MAEDTFHRTLSLLQQSNPFRIFTIELKTGERHEIDHANAFIHRDGVVLYLAPGGLPVWFDHDSVNQIIGAPADAILK